VTVIRVETSCYSIIPHELQLAALDRSAAVTRAMHRRLQTLQCKASVIQSCRQPTHSLLVRNVGVDHVVEDRLR
jgi:hypothetical protein